MTDLSPARINFPENLNYLISKCWIFLASRIHQDNILLDCTKMRKINLQILENSVKFNK